MKKEFVIFALIILFIMNFTGCINFSGDSSDPEVKSYFENEYTANDNTILSVSTTNGAISITSWDGDTITLNATKRSRYGKDDLDNAKIIVTEDANQISIGIQHSQPINSRAVDLDIKIPNNVSVKSASSTNGAITVEDVEGYIKATTTNGRIDVKGTTGIDDLKTTNGRITAEIFDIQDDVDIQTTNGRITLFIKPTLNASIQIATTNGEITIEGDFITITESSSKSYKGIIGSGGNFINVVTTNGAINIDELDT